MNDLIHILPGKWFVCFSNFPLWTKGDKTNPTFTYTLMKDKAGNALLDDSVSYWQRSKVKYVKGFDYQDSVDKSKFVWRGKGILKLLKIKWRIALVDSSNHWQVIHFSKRIYA